MRMLKALLIAFCLLTIPAGNAQTGTEPPPAQAEEALRNGTEAIRAGKFDDAKKWLETH